MNRSENNARAGNPIHEHDPCDFYQATSSGDLILLQDNTSEVNFVAVTLYPE